MVNIDNYKLLISALLNIQIEDIDVLFKHPISKEYISLKELFFEKNEEYWELGDFKVVNLKEKAPEKSWESDKRVIASFKLYQLQHCCAYIVSCNAYVADIHRNKGIGALMNKLRQDIGKTLGYSAMLCTDIETNEYQRKILKKNKWKDIHKIVNKRTNNLVYLSVISL